MTGTPQRAASPTAVRRGPGRPSRPQPTTSEPAVIGELAVHAVVVTGAPASGKTTFAVALARRCRLARFDLDEITGPLTRAALALVGAGEEALDRDLGDQLRQARYDSVLRAAAGQAVGVVVVGPFTRERGDPAAWARVVAALTEGAGPPSSPPGHGVVLVHIDTPPPLLAARMRHRNASRDLGKLTGAAPGGSLAPPVVPHVRVDGSLPVESQVDSAVDAIIDRSRPC